MRMPAHLLVNVQLEITISRQGRSGREVCRQMLSSLVSKEQLLTRTSLHPSKSSPSPLPFTRLWIGVRLLRYQSSRAMRKSSLPG